ncbi:MAG: hypothetical protein ACI4RR_01015 [Eubacterium sp.]
MKKAISQALAILLSFLFIFQTSLVAFADDEPDWQDANWTQEEFNEILSQNPNNQISTYASGLIIAYSIAISANGSNLLIAGQTLCEPNVVKCGFTHITIKRRTSSSASWTTYKTYEDIYRENSTYALTKTIAVASGYQYRVYCTHYAKKNIFSTEKISNESNVVAIG